MSGRKNDCRYYEAKYPATDDLVVVQVKRVEEMGAYVHLLEYGNVEGMILLSELSKIRIRSIQKEVKVGRYEVCSVIRVDSERGYIDLSKKRVARDDIPGHLSRFSQAKTVHSVMYQTSQHFNMTMLDLCELVSWPLYKKYGHAHKAFIKVLQEGEDIFEGIEGVSDEMKEYILDTIRKRLSPSALKIRSVIEVSCFEYEGVDAVKEALLKGNQASTQEIPVTVKLISAPQYEVTTTCMEKDVGIERVKNSCKIIQECIEAKGGNFLVRYAPDVVGDEGQEIIEIDDEGHSDSSEEDGEQDETMGTGELVGFDKPMDEEENEAEV